MAQHRIDLWVCGAVRLLAQCRMRTLNSSTNLSTREALCQGLWCTAVLEVLRSDASSLRTLHLRVHDVLHAVQTESLEKLVLSHVEKRTPEEVFELLASINVIGPLLSFFPICYDF